MPSGDFAACFGSDLELKIAGVLGRTQKKLVAPIGFEPMSVPPEGTILSAKTNLSNNVIY